MKTRAWLIFGVALAMIASTGAGLGSLMHWHVVGQAGVKIGPVPIFDQSNRLVSSFSVPLPQNIPGVLSSNLPIDTTVLNTLPPDTTYGRGVYIWTNGYWALLNVVLMGRDRYSIHQPQWCLVAQGWTIEKTETVSIPMERPAPYVLMANKLSLARQAVTTNGIPIHDREGRPTYEEALYVYWFLTDRKITPDEESRVWSRAKTMLTQKEIERWAYVSYFETCLPGQEAATFGHLEDFIRASVPEFQTATGEPVAGGASPP